MTTAPEVLTVAEAALLLRVAPTTIRSWVRRGLLPARRTAGGRHLRIGREDLNLAFLPSRLPRDGRAS